MKIIVVVDLEQESQIWHQDQVDSQYPHDIIGEVEAEIVPFGTPITPTKNYTSLPKSGEVGFISNPIGIKVRIK